ncbi:glycerol dehydratase reactivase beta/small subunit family protein [Parafrankia sp. FMc2]|uniref:glycerol dehydratase reactivase beta/small subunit family protein n=1 Tax=Parafrankia sp. FMc2 TaxID=3233196 RepID=UPI0034D6F83B
MATHPETLSLSSTALSAPSPPSPAGVGDRRVHDRRADREPRGRPAIVVRHHLDQPDPRLIREIHAGMEEEGVPFRTEPAHSDHSGLGHHDDHGRGDDHGGEAATLAYAAARASALDVGVGVDAHGTICVHHAKLPPAAPALTGPASAGRVLGHNAARLVVGLPLRPLPGPHPRKEITPCPDVSLSTRPAS